MLLLVCVAVAFQTMPCVADSGQLDAADAENARLVQEMDRMRLEYREISADKDMYQRRVAEKVSVHMFFAAWVHRNDASDCLSHCIL